MSPCLRVILADHGVCFVDLIYEDAALFAVFCYLIFLLSYPSFPLVIHAGKFGSKSFAIFPVLYNADDDRNCDNYSQGDYSGP